MAENSRPARHADHVENERGDCFLERIPRDVYAELTGELARRYHFVNGPATGGRLRLADYFLGVHRSLADELLGFVRHVIQQARAGSLAAAPVPLGFAPPLANLVPLEQQGGFTFGYFDAAVTRQGLRIIEAQAFPTYHVTAAFCSHFLQTRLALPASSIFVNAPEAGWQRFIGLVRAVTAGDASDGIVLTDRDLAGQKTSFDFYATQREIGLGLDVVDARHIFEAESRLFYRRNENDRDARPLRRLYNRVLAVEAIEDDCYPRNTDRWRFRYDRAYADLTFVNHPVKSFEVSKHILPYVSHPINPECHELTDLAAAFRRREVGYGEFVFKHKRGAAGRGLFLLPSAEILEMLTRGGTLSEYIAQRKIEYERFRTGDGREKIVEFRLMTVQSAEDLLVVPMARIGHVETVEDGRSLHRIHFGENNMPGYGFCPTLILDP